MDDNREKMNTLHIFGDSFAEDSPTSWTRKLAELQHLNINNKAKGGTSIEWSALNLQDTKLSDNDIVLFVLSNTRRFDVEPYVTHDPVGACQAKYVKSLNNSNLEWYVENRSDKVLDLKIPLYTSWLYGMAQTNPNVKFIVISGFEDSVDVNVVPDTANFKLLNSVALNQISHYEIDELRLNPYMLYNICGHDPRVNHLTTPNLNKLAHCIDNVINAWDSSLYFLKYFEKNVIRTHITTVDELDELYIKTGILDRDWVNRTMTPVINKQGSKFHMLKEWLLERNII
jgi:hypothetical protein